MSDAELLKRLDDIQAATLISNLDTVNIKMAAMMTGLSVQYLYKLVQSRQIPHYRSKGGKSIYFKKDDLTKWMRFEKVRTVDELDNEALRRVI